MLTVDEMMVGCFLVEIEDETIIFRFPSGDYQGLNESPETYAHNRGFTGQFFLVRGGSSRTGIPTVSLFILSRGVLPGEKNSMLSAPPTRLINQATIKAYSAMSG